jgi:hypothetical protein
VEELSTLSKQTNNEKSTFLCAKKTIHCNVLKKHFFSKKNKFANIAFHQLAFFSQQIFFSMRKSIGFFFYFSA